MKQFNVKLKALVDASTKLQLMNDALRSAGFDELANQVHDLGVNVSKQLGQHVIANGVQSLEAAS